MAASTRGTTCPQSWFSAASTVSSFFREAHERVVAVVERLDIFAGLGVRAESREQVPVRERTLGRILDGRREQGGGVRGGMVTRGKPLCAQRVRPRTVAWPSLVRL